MNLLTVSAISKQEEHNLVLKGLDFTLQRFQKLAIAGETGSGKTTLLKIIAGLVQPSTGEVLFEGERVQGPEERLIPGHKEIAYLSQHFELRNNYRVEELLSMASKLPEEEATTIYEVCRISHLVKRRTDQLSGGEKQRIALARVLVSLPKLLLLDEPFSNLDIIHKNILKSVINDIGERLKIDCIMILHDPLDTLSWADKILVMKAGEIIQEGSPYQIYRQPVNEYVAGLFGSYNLIPSNSAKDLSELTRAEMNGKNMLVRPENFRIGKKDKASLVGTVNKVSFFGGYYEIDVLLPEISITVRTSECTLVKGDQVFLSLCPGGAWHI